MKLCKILTNIFEINWLKKKIKRRFFDDFINFSEQGPPNIDFFKFRKLNGNILIFETLKQNELQKDKIKRFFKVFYDEG